MPSKKSLKRTIARHEVSLRAFQKGARKLRRERDDMEEHANALVRENNAVRLELQEVKAQLNSGLVSGTNDISFIYNGDGSRVLVPGNSFTFPAAWLVSVIEAEPVTVVQNIISEDGAVTAHDFRFNG